MSRRPYRVGRSSAGLGLFATKPFKKGAFVVRYMGRRVTDAESERREARGAKYMFEINAAWAIDGSSRRNIARYVNHSCRPNAEALTRRKHRIVYVARRRIKPDEEITVDYGKDYFDAYIKKSGCRCAKCKEKRSEKRLAQKMKRARRVAAKARAARLTRRTRPRVPLRSVFRGLSPRSQTARMRRPRQTPAVRSSRASRYRRPKSARA